MARTTWVEQPSDRAFAAWQRTMAWAVEDLSADLAIAYAGQPLELEATVETGEMPLGRAVPLTWYRQGRPRAVVFALCVLIPQPLLPGVIGGRNGRIGRRCRRGARGRGRQWRVYDYVVLGPNVVARLAQAGDTHGLRLVFSRPE